MREYRLWGFDGLLAGNEARLFEVKPAVIVDNQVALPRGTVVPEDPAELDVLEDPDALDMLTAVERTDFTVEPGHTLILAGEAFRRDLTLALSELTPIDTAGLESVADWILVIDGFAGRAIRPDEYKTLCGLIADVSNAVFNDELAITGARRMTDRATAAWRLFQNSPAASAEERLVQAAVYHLVRRDLARYERVIIEAGNRGFGREDFLERSLQRQRVLSLCRASEERGQYARGFLGEAEFSINYYDEYRFQEYEAKLEQLGSFQATMIDEIAAIRRQVPLHGVVGSMAIEAEHD